MKATLILIAIALSLTLALGMTQEDRAGSEFTEEYRTWLVETYPRGRFTAPATFRTCYEGYFHFYYADDVFSRSELTCWSHLVPTPVPSFLPVR